MTQIRSPQPNSKYYLPKEVFLTTIHYCKQYPIWIEELEALTDACTGIAYDSDRVQSSNDYDSTSDLGMKRMIMSRKIDLVRNTAKLVAGHHYRWLIQGCCYGKTGSRMARIFTMLYAVGSTMNCLKRFKWGNQGT